MVRRGLVWALAAWALVSACGKTSASTSPDGTPGTVAGSADLEAWELALAQARCAQERDCAGVVPKMYRSFDACLDETFDQLEGYFAYYGGLDHFAERATVYRVGSREAQQRCLDGLLACQGASEAGCDQVNVVRAPGKLGSACLAAPWHTPRPCSNGLFCSNKECTCQPKATVGERCEERECESDLYCHKTIIIMGDVSQDGPAYCERFRELGDSCGEGACRAGLVCDGGRCLEASGPNPACDDSLDCPAFSSCSYGTCTPWADRAGAGEACPQGAGCANSLMCVNGVCTELLPEGAPCQRASRLAGLGCQRWCVFDAPDALEGRCSSSPPTTGPTPCTIYRWDWRMQCPAGTHPDTHGEESAYPNLPTYCQCEPGAQEPAEGSPACP